MSPIKPENRDRYPKNWPEIRERIMERARDEDETTTAGILYPHRCECVGECGRHYPYRCERRHRDTIPNTMDPATAAERHVILTVAHLDHTPENCDEANLRAMCQRCHLAYDAPRKRADKLAAKAAGTEPLFPSERIEA